MQLSPFEQQMLEGRQGPAVELAMSVLLELGSYFDAPDFVPVSMVHDDGLIYVGQGPAEFVDHLVSLGAKVCVPTSTNACDFDLQRWQDLRIPEDRKETQTHLVNSHMQLGTLPTLTCAPYQGGIIPRFGEHIAWAESNATVFANSVLGARTNRYAGLIDLCAAITGRVPRYGLHVTENRRAKRLFTLVDFTDQMLAEPALYPLLGYLLGKATQDVVPAVSGVPLQVPVDALKGFGAAAASSGSVGLFHMIGVTPEAQTQALCFQGHRPEEEIPVTPAMVAAVQENFAQLGSEKPDLIIAGCPHYSYQEFFQLTTLLAGRKVTIPFWIYTGRAVLGRLQDAGIFQELQAGGIEVFTDGCTLAIAPEQWGVSRLMTDSMKMANYTYAQTGCQVAYASLADCVESAVAGCCAQRKMPWQ